MIKLKIQFRLAVAEWLLTKAFDWAPDDEEGANIRIVVMGYFSMDDLDRYMKTSYRKDVADARESLRKYNEEKNRTK